MLELQLLVVFLNAVCVFIYGALAIKYERGRMINAFICFLWIIAMLLNMWVLALR